MAENGNNNGESTQQLGLEAQIEALLFVAPGSVNLKQIADALQKSKREIGKGVKNLEESYQKRGIRIQEHKGEIKLTSAPELSGKNIRNI